jgi:hypothetical protein
MYNGLGSERVRFGYDADNIRLYLGVGTSPGTSALTIDGSGNIGIGTTPSAFFHVNGHQRLVGALDIKYHANIAGHNGLALGTVAKATSPSGGEGKIGIYSNDASNQLEGSMVLITDATSVNRRLVISVIEQGVGYKNITLAENGGNVGIGLSVPTSQLHVYHATSAISLLQGDATTVGYITRHSTNSSPPDLNFRKTRGTAASPTTVASSDAMGRIMFSAYGGTNYRDIALIRGAVDTYTSDTDISSNIQFWTAPTGSVTAVERMRVDPNGGLNVGYAGSGASKLNLMDSTAGVNPIISIYNSASAERVRFAYDDDNVRLQIGVGSSPSTYALAIDNSGRTTFGSTIQSVGLVNLWTAANAANVLYMYKDTQVQATIGFKSSTDTNFYVGTGSSTIGTYGLYQANTSTAWTAVSDERKKDIIEPISDAINKVSTLRSVIGRYKTDVPEKRRAFLIAQDVQAVLPEAVDVNESNEGTLGLAYTDVIPLLVAAIKELSAKVAALESNQ